MGFLDTRIVIFHFSNSDTTLEPLHVDRSREKKLRGTGEACTDYLPLLPRPLRALSLDSHDARRLSQPHLSAPRAATRPRTHERMRNRAREGGEAGEVDGARARERMVVQSTGRGHTAHEVHV